MNTWNKKPQVKKGNLGEEIVVNYISKHGFVPYKPTLDSKAHPFDLLCASEDKKTVFIAEVKAKALRQKYPDTGINMRNYNDYHNIMDRYNGINIFLFFVDEKAGKVYGNWLSILKQRRWITHNGKKICYPRHENNGYQSIIYFPKEAMRDIADLTPGEIEKLANLSTRNPKYDKGEE